MISNGSALNIPISIKINEITEQYEGIHIKAEGENKLNVYGYNGDRSGGSSDAFLALLCSNLAVNE